MTLTKLYVVTREYLDPEVADDILGVFDCPKLADECLNDVYDEMWGGLMYDLDIVEVFLNQRTET